MPVEKNLYCLAWETKTVEKLEDRGWLDLLKPELFSGRLYHPLTIRSLRTKCCRTDKRKEAIQGFGESRRRGDKTDTLRYVALLRGFIWNCQFNVFFGGTESEPPLFLFDCHRETCQRKHLAECIRF